MKLRDVIAYYLCSHPPILYMLEDEPCWSLWIDEDMNAEECHNPIGQIPLEWKLIANCPARFAKAVMDNKHGLESSLALDHVVSFLEAAIISNRRALSPHPDKDDYVRLCGKCQVLTSKDKNSMPYCPVCGNNTLTAKEYGFIIEPRYMAEKRMRK